MARKLIKTDVVFPDYLGMLKRNEQRIEKFIAATMQTNRGMMFDREGASNGHEKWAPLKYREGQILSLSGTLRKSMAPMLADGNPGPSGIVRVSGPLAIKEITIGSSLAYAPMMNWGTSGLPGGVLRPKSAKVLRFKVRGKWVFAKTVTIPARRFDESNDQDTNELKEALTNLITEILNGK